MKSFISFAVYSIGDRASAFQRDASIKKRCSHDILNSARFEKFSDFRQHDATRDCNENKAAVLSRARADAHFNSNLDKWFASL